METKASGGKAKATPPSSFSAFEEHKGVSLHLVVRDEEGKDISEVAMSKKQFSTGSYGWTLSDKVTVDNGEGGTMSVGLSGNCASEAEFGE